MALGAHFNDLLFVGLFGCCCCFCGMGEWMLEKQNIKHYEKQTQQQSMQWYCPAFFFFRFPFGFHVPRKYLARSSLILCSVPQNQQQLYTCSYFCIATVFFCVYSHVSFCTNGFRLAYAWFLFRKLFIWMFRECSTPKVEP